MSVLGGPDRLVEPHMPSRHHTGTLLLTYTHAPRIIGTKIPPKNKKNHLPGVRIDPRTIQSCSSAHPTRPCPLFMLKKLYSYSYLPHPEIFNRLYLGRQWSDEDVQNMGHEVQTLRSSNLRSFSLPRKNVTLSGPGQPKKYQN